MIISAHLPEHHHSLSNTNGHSSIQQTILDWYLTSIKEDTFELDTFLDQVSHHLPVSERYRCSSTIIENLKKIWMP